ncbi:MAG: DUF927 domain-containing protein [Pseudomonadota bacterium]
MKDGHDPLTEAFDYDPDAGPPSERPEGIPRGYRLREDGVYRRVEDKDGKPIWIWLCSPIQVLALPRDRHGRGWGRLLEVTDPDGRKHRWSAPMRLFAGDGTELRAVLMDLGFDLAPGPAARAATMEMLSRWRPGARALTAERLGWVDETLSAFVLGDGRVLGDAEVVYQSDHAPGVAEAMRPAGTLQRWRDKVASLCVDNPLVMTAVSLAFSGPLLEPLAQDGGGLHLRGASSRGKSTALRVAASVWGGPRLVQSWRATSNGLEGVAAAFNGALLALDEMGEVSGREAGAAAYMLANGTGKARASRVGTARPAARWRVAVLSSGELSLADKVAEAGGRAAAGQEVRLLDIPATERRFGAFDELHGAEEGAAFSDRVRAATAANHGTVGPTFVERLLDDLEGGVATVRTFRDRSRTLAKERFRLEAEGQVSRAVDRLALIAAAGEMATFWGLTGWSPGAALEAALTVFDLWLDGRGGCGPAEARDALERTRAFLVEHGSSRFEVLGDDRERFGGGDRPVIHRAGWKHQGLYYIAVSAWADIHSGSDPKQAARHLAEAGFLDAPQPDRFTRRTPRSVEGRPNCYAVKAEILGGGDG